MSEFKRCKCVEDCPIHPPCLIEAAPLMLEHLKMILKAVTADEIKGLAMRAIEIAEGRGP